MKNLTGYFLDKRMNVLGLVSSTIPNALRLESDNEFESIEEGTTIFDGVVSYYGADEAGSDFVKVGNYFLYEDEDGVSKAYTIIDTEKDRKRNEISFYAEDAGLSLLNSYTFPYEAVKDMTIASYFELFLKGSGFKIGTNELGDAYSRKLKWEGNATITERLLSVATQFDHADINFSFVVKGMRVTEKYVNIYKKRGIATNVTLQLNREIDNIITSESIKNLATSVLAKGGTPEGQENPITLKGYVPKVPDERFFIEGEYLRDRDSNEIWSSFLSEEEGAKGGYIERPFDYDTLSKEELYNRSVNHLKRVSQIEQNFEVDISLLPDNVRIGDTIQIVDQEDNLYLQARVLKMEKSRSLDKYVATLGEYLIKESGINQRLQELADRIAAIPRGATDYLWIRYADDDKGNGFSASPANKAYMAIKHALNQPIPSDDPKDYEGLWVLIQGEKGIPGEPGDDGLPTYTWIRYADNVSGGGISANPEGKMYIGFAHNKPTPTPSNNPEDYAWSAMYDEAKMLELQEQLNGMNYVGTNLWAPNHFDAVGNNGYINNQGANITSPNYLYSGFIKIKPNEKVVCKVYELPKNTCFFRLAFYKADGTFISFFNQTATVVNTVFEVIAPPSADTFRFDMSNVMRQGGRFKVELGNKATDYSISPLDTPTTGDLSNVQTELQQQLGSIVVPVMQPDRPIAKEGMVWWKTDVKGDVIGIEKYIGGKWEKQVIQQDTLNIINLNAVKITGSEITGTEIAGSTIISAFDNSVVQGSPIRRRGTLTLDKGYALIKYEQYDENSPSVVINKGESRMDEYGISTILRDKNDNELVSSQYGPLGININDRSKPYGSVNLSYEDLMTIRPTRLVASTDWSVYATSGDSEPLGSRQGRLVSLSGAFKPTKVLEVTGISERYVMGVLPVGLRPERAVYSVQLGSGVERFRLGVFPDGRIIADRNIGLNGYTDFRLGGWYTINTSFSAANT